MRLRHLLAPASLLITVGCETAPPLAPDDQGGDRVTSRPFRLPSAVRTNRAVAPRIDLRAEDEAKLGALKETVAAALFDALSRPGLDRAALDTSREVLSGEPIVLGALPGAYRCRTLKHGGPVPFVAYGYFDCVISEGPDGLLFEKTGGSQRMSGRLFAAPKLGADGGRALAYAGTEHQPDETPSAYPDGERSEVGLLERTGDTRYRLTIPRPGAGGLLDVIDLVRV